MALLLYAVPVSFPSGLLSEKPRTVRHSPNYHRTAARQHSLSTSISSQLSEKSPVGRRQTSFHPTVWDDSFIESLTTYDAACVTSMTQRIDELTKKVKYILIHENNPSQMINLVDAIERLGLEYHFEKEIQSTLQHVYEDCGIDDSLNDVALRFRLLRQHGYNASCDVFEKFKDKAGMFKQNLSNDVKGLLSLYEASHLRTHGENILDEALAFTTKQLKSISTHLNPALAIQVEQAMILPLHKCSPRLQTRNYISFYEADDRSNNVLLELGKLNFNLLQSSNRSEIKEVAKWRKEMDFTGNHPYARDRLVELYLWGMEMNYLPQFSKGRIALVKFLITLPLLDEAYEAYGTLDELEQFTNASTRWDLSAMDQLPYYLKLSYLTVFNLFNEIEYMRLKDRQSSCIYYLRKLFEDLCIAYLQEARWFHDGYVPNMDEYLKVTTTTTTGHILMIIAALGLRELVTKEALDYLFEESKLPWFLNLVCRFTDDLAPSQDELENGDIAKSVQCYMIEHGVSEEVTHEHIKHRIEEAWKGINQQLLQPNPLPKPLVKGMINFARLCETVFMNGNDGVGDSKSWSVDLINSLFFDPIPM